MLFFPVVAALATGLAIALWRHNRDRAIMSAGLALISTYIIPGERALHEEVRGDLLLAVSVVAMGALALGLVAIRLPSLVTALFAAGLVLIGGIASASFFSLAVRSFTPKPPRMTDEGRRAFWEETIRCQGNLARRFGSLDRDNEPCRGNLEVLSSSRCPFTRAILNDDGEFYLLFALSTGTEQTCGVEGTNRDRPVARLAETPYGVLSGVGSKGGMRVDVQLRGTGAGRCEALIVHDRCVERLELAQARLPRCVFPPDPRVRFVGAWGAAAPQPNSPRTKRLAQIWLWDMDGAARGLIVGAVATIGTEVPFLLARALEGESRSGNAWDLRVVDRNGVQANEAFTFTLAGGHVRVAGSKTLFGPAGEMLLDAKEIVWDPRIALAPVSDRGRFGYYFDNVFVNLNVPWTVK